MAYETITMALMSFVGIPVLRSVTGWAEKALKDNKVTVFEWKQLTKTVIRVGVMGVLAWFGLAGAGVEVHPLAAGAAAFFADRIIDALKENRAVRP